jgi:uncharacterized protein (DUF2141 family)
MKARLAFSILLAATSARAEPGVVTVTISGVRSNAGHVLVAICDRATFLEPNCRYAGRTAASPGAVTVRIAGVPLGVYAAQAFHDENDNGKIDRNFLGIPREGLGFSNDAKMRFGPPSFDDAAFSLGPNGGSIGFALRYFD